MVGEDRISLLDEVNLVLFLPFYSFYSSYFFHFLKFSDAHLRKKCSFYFQKMFTLVLFKQSFLFPNGRSSNRFFFLKFSIFAIFGKIRKNVKKQGLKDSKQGHCTHI